MSSHAPRRARVPYRDALPVDLCELVAIDLDGTLLRSDHTLSDTAVQTIHAARSAGVRIVLVSARPPRTTRRYYEQLGLDTLIISQNGALVYDPVNQKVVRHLPLAGPVARQVIAIARQTDPALAVGVEVIDRLYTPARSDAPAGTPSVPNDGHDAEGLEAALSRHVTRVVLLGTPQALGEAQLRLGGSSLEVAVTFSHQRLLQVVAARARKGVALQVVAEHYGVARERVMAIGDAPNDTDMLQWAGISVAMANAWNEVRRIAHFTVASNDDDGVAEALRKYAMPM